MKRNWITKYHKDNQQLPQVPEASDESSDSGSESTNSSNEIRSSQAHFRQRFSVWLNIVCYTAALSILIYLFADWATNRIPIDPETDEPDLSDQSSNFPEPESVISPDQKAQLERILEDPQQESSFRDRLNSLYLVLLGAVAGYLHALRQSHEH